MHQSFCTQNSKKFRNKPIGLKTLPKSILPQEFLSVFSTLKGLSTFIVSLTW